MISVEIIRKLLLYGEIIMNGIYVYIFIYT